MFDPAKFGKWAHKALQVDEVTMARARKVAALYRRGTTEGERAAAYNRLEAIATAAKTDVATLLRCC
jgi:hypothetical protein